MTFDYLIVGAGLFGATCARVLTDAGRSVLVIEKRDHVAGMAATEMRDGQLMQSFGGHIFHTNDRRLWDYVGRFAEMRPYWHRVKARAAGRVYSLPIGLSTLQDVFGAANPREGRELLHALKVGSALNMSADMRAANARDWAVSQIGQELYALFVEGYTTKMWGRCPCELPAGIVQRLPVRTTWDDHYFTDRYQGLPADGYTSLVETMLKGIAVELGADYLDRAHHWDEQADRVIYTGPVDALFGYQLGRLEYRSLEFQHERFDEPDVQGCATMNYTDREVPWLRMEEWRHWGPWAPRYDNGSPSDPPGFSWVTRTSPAAYAPGVNEPLYPVNDGRNQALYDGYCRLAAGHKPHVLLGGRLGAYRYWDMHQAIGAALRLVETELERKGA